MRASSAFQTRSCYQSSCCYTLGRIRLKMMMVVEYLKKVKQYHTTIEVLAVMLLLLISVPISEAQSDNCNGVDCGKGQCESELLGYQCHCDPGWTQIIPSVPFLSCIIPNCTLNFSCAGSPASPPLSTILSPTDFGPPLSNLTLCGLPGLCGSGNCIPISSGLLPSYECDCPQGSSNLFNLTTGPCLPECAVNGSCAALNLPISSAPPSNGSGIAPAPNSIEGSVTPSPTPGHSNTVNSSNCANVDCWKGTCAPVTNLPWLPQYSCNCDHGWLNLLNLSYLACGLPDCEVSDPSCGMLHHPRSLTLPSLQDLLNPCTLSLCGDGRCVSTNKSGILDIQIPSYNCICNEGASNLLNNTSGMCVPDDCIPQCLGGLGWGETQPPTVEDPFGGPFALSPDDTYSATPGRRQEGRLGYIFGVITIFAASFW